MTRDFWIGLALLPALAVGGALLWLAARYLNRAGAWLVNRLGNQQPKRLGQRAAVGAVITCARRAWWLKLPFDSVLILAAGHDMAQFEPIRKAIYGVIGPKVTINPKYLRKASAGDGE